MLSVRSGSDLGLAANGKSDAVRYSIDRWVEWRLKAVPVVQRVGTSRINAALTGLLKARACLDHSFLELDKKTAERVVRPVTRRLF